ncbi:MAG TPA: S8 family serine peptidase [Gemmatimonadaceae bacterium]|nr:S8 family serine peptidase [Gemmatimonadaceae bacterium]
MTTLPAVILVDTARFTDAYSDIVAAVASARSFVTLPIYLAGAADPGLDEVVGVDGVLGVFPGDELILSMLQGLDRVAQLCLGLLDDWTVGGVARGEPYPFVFEEPEGVAAPPAVCAAVNISLTPANDSVAPTLPTDLINHATRVVAPLTLPVVAAGNHHDPMLPFETVSPWAEPDWVLAVGATTDRAGEMEWPRSARGSSRNRHVGPDILTWGQDRLSRDGFGTSFAAARMSAMAILCRGWLFQVAANIDRLAGRDFGVPLVGGAVIDRELTSVPSAPAGAYNALPVLAADPRALEHSELDAVCSALKGSDAIRVSRVLLLAAAAATSPRPVTPLSAPSLTPERLQQFLDTLSVRRLLELAWPHASSAANETPIFPPGNAIVLQRIIENSEPAWGWNIDTQTPYIRPHASLPT